MPKMTKRWRNAAVLMAVLGFVAVSLRLLVPEKVLVAADSNCIPFFQSLNGRCLQWAAVQYNVPTLLVGAAINALVWFGVVYLVYLLVYGLRRTIRGGSRPPSATASVEASPDPDKPEISREP